jgi:hypothetical protein
MFMNVLQIFEGKCAHNWGGICKVWALGCSLMSQFFGILN